MLLHEIFTTPILDGIWILYILLCLPLVILMRLCLPYRFRFPVILSISFFYLLSASLFGIGIIISLIVILMIHFSAWHLQKMSFAATYFPDYQKAPIMPSHAYGEGSGYKLIASRHFSKGLREKMVTALNQYNYANVNQMNKLALQDETEEIRLYAQIFIEKQEREITRQAKDLRKKINETEDKTRRAYYEKKMALTMWEILYKNLFIQENLLPALEEIKAHALNSFKFIPQDIELPLLIAKIELRKNALQEAIKWLEIADKNNAPDYKIFTYLAEIAYQKKRFHEIPEILKKIHAKGILGLEPHLSFWIDT